MDRSPEQQQETLEPLEKSSYQRPLAGDLSVHCNAEDDLHSFPQSEYYLEANLVHAEHIVMDVVLVLSLENEEPVEQPLSGDPSVVSSARTTSPPPQLYQSWFKALSEWYIMSQGKLNKAVLSTAFEIFRKFGGLIHW